MSDDDLNLDSFLRFLRLIFSLFGNVADDAPSAEEGLFDGFALPAAPGDKTLGAELVGLWDRGCCGICVTAGGGL